MQQEVDRALEGGRGDRICHAPTIPNLPPGPRTPRSRSPGGRGGQRPPGVPWRPMKRVLSGIAPSGDFTLGNYLGALRHWVTFQDDTTPSTAWSTSTPSPSTSTRRCSAATPLDAALNLLAVGLDPQRCTIFVQSHVPEHTRLTWLLECTATMGELRRMTQFKEKGRGQRDGARRPVHLPGADGGRHPALRRRGGARSGTTSASIWSSPASWPSASTIATGRRSPSPRRPFPGRRHG